MRSLSEKHPNVLSYPAQTSVMSIAVKEGLQKGEDTVIIPLFHDEERLYTV
jgi:hypothetical protein